MCKALAFGNTEQVIGYFVLKLLLLLAIASTGKKGSALETCCVVLAETPASYAVLLPLPEKADTV